MLVLIWGEGLVRTCRNWGGGQGGHENEVYWDFQYVQRRSGAGWKHLLTAQAGGLNCHRCVSPARDTPNARHEALVDVAIMVLFIVVFALRASYLGSAWGLSCFTQVSTVSVQRVVHFVEQGFDDGYYGCSLHFVQGCQVLSHSKDIPHVAACWRFCSQLSMSLSVSICGHGRPCQGRPHGRILQLAHYTGHSLGGSGLGRSFRFLSVNQLLLPAALDVRSQRAGFASDW